MVNVQVAEPMLTQTLAGLEVALLSGSEAVIKIVSKLGGPSTKKLADWFTNKSAKTIVLSLKASHMVAVSFNNVQ